jgi:hypothetical protein
MAKTVVALFEDAWNAHRAVQDLLGLGIARQDIGVLMRDPVSVAEEGRAEVVRAQEDAGSALIGGMTGAFVGLGLLTIPVIGPILAIGPLALGAIGASIGEILPSWASALARFGVPIEHARLFTEGVRRGGALVTVNAHADLVDRVREVIERNRPVDVEARAREWHAEGWHWDDSAPLFSRQEIDAERARHGLDPLRPSRPSMPWQPLDRPSRPSSVW